MLYIRNLTCRIAGRTLLSQATATVSAGQRVALVGRNGTGKSTLFKIIQGSLAPDEGDVSVPSKWSIGSVAQEAPSSSLSLIDTVLEADTTRTLLLRELETCSDPEKIADIHARLHDIEAHTAPSRAAKILWGLGFSAEAQKRPCHDFSGGWRMRVALAAILFRQPDLLLLDEPTNHLDLEATLWLEEYLKSYKGTLLLISHDRTLLNHVPTGILHLDQEKLTAYEGGYDQFEETRRLRQAHQAAQAARQEAARQHMQSYIDRFRYKASKARQAQSRLKALEKMKPVDILPDEAPAHLSFPPCDILPPPLITLDNASLGYDGKAVLKQLNLRIDPDDRIGLLGANGNGKTTLMKALAGRLPLLSGDMRRSDKVRTGYFAQHQSTEFVLTRTVLEEAQARMPRAAEEAVRRHLGRFSFSGDSVHTLVGHLSGGEKARLLLAFMARESPHLLLLDEPTNHLDIASREALIQAINDFPGAVIVISHDPYLLGLTVDRFLLVHGGECIPYDGALDDYRNAVLRGAFASNEQNAPKPLSSADNKKEQRRQAAQDRLALAPYQKKLKEAEHRLHQLHQQRDSCRQQLADPSLYTGSPSTLTRLQITLGQIEKDIEAAEAAWLDAAETFEKQMLST